MRVDYIGSGVQSGSEGHEHGGFVDNVGCVGAEDVDADYAAAFLHQPSASPEATALPLAR